MPLKDRIIIFVCQPDHRCTRPRNTEHSTPALLVVKQNSHSGTRPEKNHAYHSHSTLLRATKEAGFPDPLASGDPRGTHASEPHPDHRWDSHATCLADYSLFSLSPPTRLRSGRRHRRNS